MLKELDVVRAARDISDVIGKDCIGVILLVYSKPTIAYEVEFFDDEHNTIGILPVQPNDIELR